MEKNTSRNWFLLFISIIFMIVADLAMIFNYMPIAFLIIVIVGIIGMEIYRIE